MSQTQILQRPQKLCQSNPKGLTSDRSQKVPLQFQPLQRLIKIKEHLEILPSFFPEKAIGEIEGFQGLFIFQDQEDIKELLLIV